MKAKDVLVSAGLLGVGFVFGMCKGIIGCGNAINEKLRAEHDLEVEEIWWKPIGCKFTKVGTKDLKTEGSAE